MTILPALTARSVLVSTTSRRALRALLGLAAGLLLGCASKPSVSPAPRTVAASSVPVVKAEAPILTVGVPVERSLTPGGRDEIALNLETGLYLRLAFDGRGAKLDIGLFGPDGGVVAREVGDSEGRLAWTTRTAGIYRIAATSPKAKVPSRYQILLLNRRPAAPDDDKRLEADGALLAARQEEDGARAVQQAQRALTLWSELQDADGQFEALQEIGNKDTENSISWYGKALEQAEATGNLAHRARAHADLGEALTPRNLAEARLHLEAALPLWKTLGDAYQQSRTLYYLGFGRSTSGKKDEALSFYQEALRSADLTWDITPDLLNVVGQLYSRRGQSHEALGYYERALKCATDMDWKGGRATALASLGDLHWRRGEPRIALDQFDESLQINQGNPQLVKYVGPVLNNIGAIKLGLGQPEEALANFQRALKTFQQVKDELWISRALVSIGRANLLLHQPATALENFQEALKIAISAKFPNERGSALQWIGVAQFQLHQVPQAIQSLRDALQIQSEVDRPGQALTQQTLGEAYREQGDLVAAREALGKALQITEEVEAIYSRPPILLDLARLERQQGNLPEALTRIEEAINILETVRSDLADDRLRTSFFASRRSYYDFWVELLMDLDRQAPGQDYPDRAFAASEKGRSRSLLDLLAKGRSELTQGISLDLRRQEEEVEARLFQIRRDLVDARSDQGKARLIGSLEEQLKSFGEQQQRIEARIKAESPQYAQIRYPSPLQRREIQKLLQPDEALLEYSLGESGAYLFVVTTERLTVYPLKMSPAQIGKEVETVRAALENQGRLSNAFLKAARRLYVELIDPAQPEIQGRRRLLIAPDGVLYHLAFEALLARDAYRESECHFLIEDRAVSYVPSASVLSSLSEKSSPTAGSEPAMRFIAFAPAYAAPSAAEERTRNAGVEDPGSAVQGSTLPDLEGARQEVVAISHLYPDPELKVYLGAEASRENFKRTGQRTASLHFAGHGVLDERRPELSSLEFTDGSLNVDDIFNLDLNANLVVLSACRTAGKVVTGEGLVGLTRAFLYAGAPSVIVTLWRAVDTSARDLMVEFYGNLHRSGDKAEALRQAKLAVIEQGRKSGRLNRPYYWAPFILVGKPR